MKSQRYLTAVLCVLIIGSAVPARAQSGHSILDQSNAEALSSAINGGSSAYEWQQGITVGVAGQLTRISIYVLVDEGNWGPNGPTQLSVALGAPWQSGAPVWHITAMLQNGWNVFDVSKARIAVEIGDELTLGVHGEGGSNFNPGIGISYADQYPGGDLLMNGSVSSEKDILFRTYVSPKRSRNK